jgi:hypothetical protein
MAGLMPWSENAVGTSGYKTVRTDGSGQGLGGMWQATRFAFT